MTEEYMEAYRTAISFFTHAQGLATDEDSPHPAGSELRRAAVSLVVHIAHGAGRDSPNRRSAWLDAARGRARECAALLGEPTEGSGADAKPERDASSNPNIPTESSANRGANERAARIATARTLLARVLVLLIALEAR